MNILRHVIQLMLDINKIQAEAVFKVYGRFGLYRRLYIACGFPEGTAKRLEERLLALGHEGVAEQHEILCRFVRGDIGVVQLFEELTQWFSDYMENCQAAAMDEVHAAA
ncbi:hypothetical protein WME90_42560 [Sorangium sp. So ce375]|uniref:hypothetical protein n=1 Tax=Sorangium sp. So ce375 TaxID=3133306 RepID=UPI003F5B9F02